VTRHAAADPGDAAFARKLNGGFCRARDDQMAHAVVALDEGGCHSGALHDDIRTRIRRLEPEPLDVLRQAKHAVRVGAAQIRLQHELGDLPGVIAGHVGFVHRVNDQTGDSCRWNPNRLGGLDVHDFPDNRASAREPRIVAWSASEIFNDSTCFTQSIMPIS